MQTEGKFAVPNIARDNTKRVEVEVPDIH